MIDKQIVQSIHLIFKVIRQPSEKHSTLSQRSLISKDFFSKLSVRCYFRRPQLPRSYRPQLSSTTSGNYLNKDDL
jgi:hypothetical protein